MEFHHSCWKTFRESKSIHSDGLDLPCFTPDCIGTIARFTGFDEKNAAFANRSSQVLEEKEKKKKVKKPKKVVKEKEKKYEKKKETKDDEVLVFTTS